MEKKTRKTGVKRTPKTVSNDNHVRKESNLSKVAKLFPTVTSKNSKGNYVLGRSKSDIAAIDAVLAIMESMQVEGVNENYVIVFRTFVAGLTLESDLGMFKIARLMASRDIVLQTVLRDILWPLVDAKKAYYKENYVHLAKERNEEIHDFLRWVNKAPTQFTDPKLFADKFMFYIANIK